MTTQIIIAVSIMVVVLLLTLISIWKGYDYKHSVDPLPQEENDRDGLNRHDIDRTS